MIVLITHDCPEPSVQVMQRIFLSNSAENAKSFGAHRIWIGALPPYIINGRELGIMHIDIIASHGAPQA